MAIANDLPPKRGQPINAGLANVIKGNMMAYWVKTKQGAVRIFKIIVSDFSGLFNENLFVQPIFS